MKSAGYSALTGAKRLRGRLVESLRDTALWRPLRVPSPGRPVSRPAAGPPPAREGAA